MSQFTGIMVPLLLHLCTTEIVAVVFGGKLDAAARTLLVALLVLPWAAWMYRKDCRISGADGNAEKKADLKKERRKRFLRCAFCFIAGGIMNTAWSGVMAMLQIQQHFSNTVQERLLAGQFAVQILSMGFLVPLTEELVFRGLIYRRMSRMLPYMQSVILASALFAVYHGNVIQMVFAFPMAVVICVLYEKWQLFRYPFLFHMGCNLTAIMINYVSI